MDRATEIFLLSFFFFLPFRSNERKYKALRGVKRIGMKGRGENIRHPAGKLQMRRVQFIVRVDASIYPPALLRNFSWQIITIRPGGLHC